MVPDFRFKGTAFYTPLGGTLQPAGDGWVQAYFRNTQGTASSDSAWMDNPVALGSGTAAGQFDFNLSDGNFLGGDGAAQDGDVVVIAFWRAEEARGLNQNKDFSWRSFVLDSGNATIDLSDGTQNPVGLHGTVAHAVSNLWGVQSMAKLFNRPTSTKIARGTSQLFLVQNYISDTLNDNKVGRYYPAAIQKTLDVFPELEYSLLEIEWMGTAAGDGTAAELQQSVYGPMPLFLTHTFNEAPGSPVNIWRRPRSIQGWIGDATVKSGYTIVSRWPQAGFTWEPAEPTPGATATFTPAITDPDSVVSDVGWSVDSGTTWATGYGTADTFTHSWATAGTANVTQRLLYNDGVDDLSATAATSFFVANALPTIGTLAWTPETWATNGASVNATYTPTVTDPDDVTTSGLDWSFDGGTSFNPTGQGIAAAIGKLTEVGATYHPLLKLNYDRGLGATTATRDFGEQVLIEFVPPPGTGPGYVYDRIPRDPVHPPVGFWVSGGRF